MLRPLPLALLPAALLALTLAAAPPASQDPITRTYDISVALLTPGTAGPIPTPTDFDHLNLSPFNDPATGMKVAEPVDKALPLEQQSSALNLLAAIKQRLSPSAVAQIKDTTLTLTASSADHAAFSRTLDTAIHANSTTLAVTSRIFTVDHETLRTLPDSLQDTLAATTANRRNPTPLTPELADLLLAAVQKSRLASVHQAPRITLFPNQSSRVLMGEYQFFATAYSPDLKPIQSPTFVGTSIHLLAHTPSSPAAAEPLPAPSSVLLTYMQSSLTSVTTTPGPIAADGKQLTTQSPNLTTTSWQGLITLPPNQSALIPLSSTPTSTSYLLVNITPGSLPAK